jgi:hypothetical protein
MRKNRPDDDRLRYPNGPSKNCRTNPSSETIPPSSPAYPATPSWRRVEPSPPHCVPLGAASKSHGASPWASPGRLRHVRVPSEALPDRLCPAKSTVHLVLPLALVDEIVAITAQEVAPRPVQNRNPAAAPGSRTDEPGPLSTEVASRPAQGHGLLHVLPLFAWTASVAVCQDYLLRLLVS